MYEKLAPHDSYIHIDSFKDLEEFKNYLDDVSNNSEKLGKYLRWKETFGLTNVYWYTQLCNMLQGISDEKRFTIDNINDKISMC